MGLAQYFHRSAPVLHTTTTSKDTALFWPFLVSNAVLSALSITNLGLISSMVAWLLEQKHNVHNFVIDWPGLQFDLNVEPKNLWVDQGHESNGVAGYGFFLGIFGMITAWRYRKAARVCPIIDPTCVMLADTSIATEEYTGSCRPPATVYSLHTVCADICLRCHLSDYRAGHPSTHRCQP